MRLHDFLDYHAKARPDAEFAVQGARRWTYGQAFADTNRLANGLLAGGIRPGDRVGILARNSYEYVATYFGASKAGAVLVPLNGRLTPSDWSYVLQDSGARMVLAGEHAQAGLEGVRAELPAVERWVQLGGPAREGWTALEAWLAGAPSTPPDLHVTPEHIVYQMYTSGTTGKPKGAVISQRAATINVLQFSHAFGPLPGVRCLTVAPLFHVAAALITFCAVSWGDSLYIQEEFRPDEAVRALSEEGIAFTILVPSMIQACLAAVPDVAQRKYPALRHMLYGASPIAEKTLRRAMEVFGCDFTGGYGMTETAGVNCVLLPEAHREALKSHPERLLSTGRPTLGTEIRVVDGERRVVGPRVLGEIEIRGPQLMNGYWNDPRETAQAMKDGWLRTGDVGSFDEDGYLYIQDRLDDMIISGGENVASQEVEQVIAQHPAVAEAAVIGVPDEKWGEHVKAVVVVRKEHEVSADELIAFCRDRLAAFKRPRSVDFLAQLPRNSAGKILKRQLREPYWAGRRRRVGGA